MGSREMQLQTWQENREEPLMFAPGEMVWLANIRWRKGSNLKLQPKFAGRYHVIEAFPNHTYLIERSRQSSIQNESRLKPYTPCNV